MKNLTIKELIDFYQIKNLIVHEKLIFYLYKEEKPEIELPPDPDELFREPMQILYSVSSKTFNKLLVGKLIPKPCILILSDKGEPEDHLKLKDVTFSEVSDKSVEFSSKSG